MLGTSVGKQKLIPSAMAIPVEAPPKVFKMYLPILLFLMLSLLHSELNIWTYLEVH